MLNFLNLKSFPSNLFLGVASSLSTLCKVTVVSEEITDKPSPSWFYISKTWMHPANSWSSPFLFQLRQNREDVRVSKKMHFWAELAHCSGLLFVQTCFWQHLNSPNISLYMLFCCKCSKLVKVS